jgi:hypothetical protein
MFVLLKYLYLLVTTVVGSFVVQFNQIYTFAHITETANGSSQTVTFNCWISAKKIQHHLLHINKFSNFLRHHITATCHDQVELNRLHTAAMDQSSDIYNRFSLHIEDDCIALPSPAHNCNLMQQEVQCIDFSTDTNVL